MYLMRKAPLPDDKTTGQSAWLLLYLFFIDAILNLYGELTANQLLLYISKPLLISLLAIWFYFTNQRSFSQTVKFVFIGLLFSVCGDVLLMFTAQASIFFLLGLISFLLAHCCYIAGFLSYPAARQGFVKRKVISIIPFLLFLILFNSFLYNNIPVGLKIPVLVYSMVIILMAITALNLQSLLPKAAFQSLFAGVLLFLCSDSILAIEKFKTLFDSEKLSGFMIMISYISGQYSIAKGITKASSNASPISDTPDRQR